MRAAPEQNINVHLARRNQQRVGVVGRNDRVAMGEANAQAAVRHNFRQGQIRRVDVEITPDNMQVRCNLPQELKGAAVG